MAKAAETKAINVEIAVMVVDMVITLGTTLSLIGFGVVLRWKDGFGDCEMCSRYGINNNLADSIDTTNSDLAELNNNLAGKAPVNHTHAWSAITSKPSTYTPSSHTHDDRYYTESETNSLLSGYIPKNGGGIITGTLQVSGGVKANGTYVVQGSTASQIRLNWTGSLMQVFVDNTLIGSIMFK